jgi:hypothetical protein
MCQENLRISYARNKNAIQRGTARAVSCTRDALCGGEEADGCCATKQSSIPAVPAEYFSLIEEVRI